MDKNYQPQNGEFAGVLNHQQYDQTPDLVVTSVAILPRQLPDSQSCLFPISRRTLIPIHLQENSQGTDKIYGRKNWVN